MVFVLSHNGREETLAQDVNHVKGGSGWSGSSSAKAKLNGRRASL